MPIKIKVKLTSLIKLYSSSKELSETKVPTKNLQNFCQKRIEDIKPIKN